MMKGMILVTGLGRCGTSVVTKGLEILGCDLGEEPLRGPDEGNQKGYFENSAVIELNTRIVEAGIKRPKSISKRAFVHGAVDVITKLLDECYPDREEPVVYAIKDPRLSVLYSTWIASLAICGFKTRLIICKRDEGKILKSCLNQVDMGVSQNPRSEKFFTEIFEDYKGGLEWWGAVPQIVMQFDRLGEKSEWEKLKEFDLPVAPLDRSFDKCWEEIQEFYDPSLIRF